ncbi:MAG TPA: DUF2062 domain-containing protein [Nitrospirota bacterium]|nr:DUF2062 domain-containing protein [Nitrospirota bacterium]
MKSARGKRDCRRWLKYQHVKLSRLNDTPEKVAGGLAVGVILGILPTFGLGVIIAVFIAGPLKVNKAAAIIGTFVMNPWTSPFFWGLSYLAGSLALGYSLPETIAVIKMLKTHGDLWENILAQRLLLPYVIGNAIVMASAAACFYVGGLYGVKAYRAAKKKRLIKKRAHNRMQA